MSIRLDDRPRQRRVVTSGPATDGSVTVTRDGQVIELNATAAALWALCDGETAVAEIVHAATSFFSGSHASITQDIVTTLETLERQGLVTR